MLYLCCTTFICVPSRSTYIYRPPRGFILAICRKFGLKLLSNNLPVLRSSKGLISGAACAILIYCCRMAEIHLGFVEFIPRLRTESGLNFMHAVNCSVPKNILHEPLQNKIIFSSAERLRFEYAPLQKVIFCL